MSGAVWEGFEPSQHVWPPPLLPCPRGGSKCPGNVAGPGVRTPCRPGWTRQFILAGAAGGRGPPCAARRTRPGPWGPRHRDRALGPGGASGPGEGTRGAVGQVSPRRRHYLRRRFTGNSSTPAEGVQASPRAGSSRVSLGGPPGPAFGARLFLTSPWPP